MQRFSYRISKTGSLRRLRLVGEEIGEPADCEIAVAVRAIGLNFADVFTVLGLYGAAPRNDFIPGIEFSGVVADRGKNVTRLEVGDRVMGSIRFGAYTTRLNIDERYVLPIPSGWSFEEGASFIVHSLTAYYALVTLGNLQPNHTVLIHSAAGGVGIYAVRIAKLLGAYTIGTVGSASKVRLAEDEGCDAVILRRRGFPDDVRAALKGRELDLVLDSIGGKVQKQSFELLGTSGRLVAYGLSEFASHRATPDYLMLARRFLAMPRYHTLTLIESNKSILGFNLIWLYDRVDMLKRFFCEVQALELPSPHVGTVLPFDRLKEAVRLLQSGTTTGKVVVAVEQNNPVPSRSESP